jgi:hypothetical protein
MDSIEDTKKKVREAMRGLDACLYGSCSKCPYHNDGCQNRLFRDSSGLLSDFLANIRNLRDK